MKEFLMWTVVWNEKAKEQYGVKDGDIPLIMIDESLYSLSIDVSENKRGRPKSRTATTYPFFETKKEAEAFREGNDDFVSIQMKITPITNEDNLK